MSLITKYREEIEAVILVLLVGANVLGYVPVEVLVPIAALVSADATRTLKKKTKDVKDVVDKM